MIKAIIFDLDGTLLDTMDDLAYSVNYILSKNNLPNKTKEEIMSYIGNGVKQLVARCLPKGEEYPNFEEIYLDFEKFYLENCDKLTKPYEGIIELLKELKGKYKLGVISNKSNNPVQLLIEKYFPKLFDYVLGLKQPFNRKPHQDLLIHMLNELGLDNTEVVYIGDSEVDISFAFNAQVQIISVDYGFRNKEFLIEKGAKLIASKPSEILAILKTLEDNYCSACGNKLILHPLKEEGLIPYCKTCNKYRFPSFSTAVSMIVVNKDETKILLIQQYNSKRNILVAGYVNIGESLEHAVVREVKEEVGLNVIDISFNKSEYFAKSRTLMVNFIAKVDSEEIHIKENEVDRANWYDIGVASREIAPYTLAERFINHYIEKK